MMGCELQVDSAPGRGSRLWFDLPLAPTAETPQASSPTLSGLRVLVVEDNPVAREAALAATQGDALPSLDVALIDWRLPGEDGIALGRRLRERAGPGSRLRLILCTRSRLQEAQAANAGAVFDAMIEKPVTLGSLLNKLIDAPSATQQDTSASSPAVSLSGVRVLVVDDVEINRELACELLIAAGAETDTAADGIAAVETLEAEPLPHLVLMDVQMPELDGISATRRLRERYAPAELPIVAMTAHAFREEIEACIAAGMQAHLAKPINPETLLATVDAERRRPAVQRAQAPVEMSGPIDENHAALPVALQQLAGLDISAGLHRVLGRSGLYLSMLRAFSVRYAEAAVMLRRFHAEGDSEGAEHAAHALRGAAAMLGADDIAVLAGQIEYADDKETSGSTLDRLQDALDRLREALVDADREPGDSA
jgi:CheY-like chemotaxis protein